MENSGMNFNCELKIPSPIKSYQKQSSEIIQQTTHEISLPNITNTNIKNYNSVNSTTHKQQASMTMNENLK
jgi:hypothetical protein